MNILGPLNLSMNGNQYVLIITDQFIKWVECFLLPHASECRKKVPGVQWMNSFSVLGGET